MSWGALLDAGRATGRFVGAAGLATVWAMAGACTDTSNNAEAPPDVPLPDAGTDAAGGAPGYLWYAGAALNAFTRARTESPAGGPPLGILPSGSPRDFHDLAFDRAGNLWAVPITGDRILRLAAAQLVSGAPVPELAITGPALKGPHSIAFDPAGNLWVMCYDGTAATLASIVRLDAPSVLSGEAAPPASAVIGPAGGAADRFGQGMNIAFDAAGNLWFASISSIMRFEHPGDLHGATAPAAAATLSTGEAYASIAFDAQGSLWVTGAKGGYVALRFERPGEIAGLATPTPSAVVTLAAGSSLFAAGMGFDSAGSLWIAMSDRLVKLAGASDLRGVVEGTVAASLEPAYPDLSSKLLFRPTPAGLPIYEP